MRRIYLTMRHEDLDGLRAKLSAQVGPYQTGHGVLKSVRRIDDDTIEIGLSESASQQHEEAVCRLVAGYDPDNPTGDEDLRQQIIALAQSAVGVDVRDLTASQVRALTAIIWWKQGAVANDGTIRPLADWVRD